MLEALLIRYIKTRIAKAMFKKLAKKALESKTLKGKLTLASTLPLVVGAVSGAFGLDIAPTEVDLIVTAVASLGVFIGHARAVYQALRA